MSCKPLRILFENQLIGAQMTAQPTALTEPLNMLTEQRSRVFRSYQSVDDTGKIIQQIYINRTDRSFVADSFAIAQHNLDGVDSIRLQLFDGEEQAGKETYDSTVQRAAVLIPMDIWRPGVNYWGETYSPAGLDRITPLWFDPVPWRSALVTITSSLNPAQYIDVGMMMLGLSVRPENNFSWGNSISWQSDVQLTRTQGGSLMSQRGMSGHREMTLSLDWMSDGDRNKLGTECRKYTGKPVLISAYPESTDQVRRAEYTMIAKIEPGTDWVHAQYQQHQHVFKFLEV